MMVRCNGARAVREADPAGESSSSTAAASAGAAAASVGVASAFAASSILLQTAASSPTNLQTWGRKRSLQTGYGFQSSPSPSSPSSSSGVAFSSQSFANVFSQ